MTNNQDDSFREIQLGGKQLVFLAMAVVVIGVTIFLTGVMVGRGVLAARGAPGVESTVSAAESDPPPPPASASPGTSTTPATAAEKLSYAERLGSGDQPKEPLKAEANPAPPEAAPAPKADAPATTPTPAASPAPPPPAPAPVAAAPAPAAAPKTAAPVPAAKSAEPAGGGFAIQVAALREPAEADAIVKRLAGKGYPAYVVTPQKGSAPIYRVRVGKFKERREADTVAAKLQKEEQFKPWIVR